MKPQATLALLGLCLAAGLTACGPDMTRSEQITDRVIRSIAAGDRHGAESAFDGSVRPTMTPSSFAYAARIIHSFGSYHYTSEVSQLPHDRYDLEAAFDHGSMLVQLRLNAAGQILALHMTPNFTDRTP